MSLKLPSPNKVPLPSLQISVLSHCIISNKKTVATALPSRKIKTSIENQGEYKQALMFLNNSKKSTVNDEDDLWDREVSV